ncbi:hypothetical protein COV16_06500 [Candidatus Woesearchaeota archaeon CG10_big_fil_rev_8_21_14_0_10_34_8]|nr:MAG: hypothetical protein COV16_06500 [Candidatus Woesearchaeota archaeon CG10_big_fil_rev_8_21_14_0_10_34_8]
MDNLLSGATLDEALGRVVIKLRPEGSSGLVHAMRKSRFLNHYGGNNKRGVLPNESNLVEWERFSSGEHRFRMLPYEYPVGKRPADPHMYSDSEGSEQRFFDPDLQRHFDGKVVHIVAEPSTNLFWQPDQIVYRTGQVVRAVKKLGASKAYVTFSEFPFARQDRSFDSPFLRGITPDAVEADRLKHAGQTDYVTDVLIALIARGCDGVATMHHHSPHFADLASSCLADFGRNYETRYTFDICPTSPVAQYIRGSDIFTDDEKANNGEGIAYIAPDKRALSFVMAVRERAGHTNASLAYIEKARSVANDPDSLKGQLFPVEGFPFDYDGKVGIVLDDIIDTFGTMDNALRELPDSITRFVVYATHGIFAGHAAKRMRLHPRITDVLLMDTRYSRIRTLEPGAKEKTTSLKPAGYFAHALVRCVESGVDPVAFYDDVFKQKPEFFSNPRVIQRKIFSEHYSNGN